MEVSQIGEFTADMIVNIFYNLPILSRDNTFILILSIRQGLLHSYKLELSFLLRVNFSPVANLLKHSAPDFTLLIPVNNFCSLSIRIFYHYFMYSDLPHLYHSLSVKLSNV
jgi:hypothetical protein